QGDSWSLAWTDPRFASGLVSVVLPHGVDAAALAGLTLDSASWATVAPIAARLRASDVVVADFNPGQNSVRLKRLAAGMPLPANIDSPGKTPAAAAEAAFNTILDFWKNKSAVDFNQRSHLTVEARFSSLSEWAALQAKLGAVPTVVGIDMVAFNLSEARLALAYAGNFEQLRGALADAGIAMTSRDGTWWLSRAEGLK
ncbi:MAG TPA: hypothetical protein VL026_14955, partial [Rhizomicrobium sp.]|nr:hypothetical protein [Rhizomicrobium sp.]